MATATINHQRVLLMWDAGAHVDEIRRRCPRRDGSPPTKEAIYAVVRRSGRKQCRPVGRPRSQGAGVDWAHEVQSVMHPGRADTDMTSHERRLVTQAARMCAKLRERDRPRRRPGYCHECGADCALGSKFCDCCQLARNVAARVLWAHRDLARMRTAPKPHSERSTQSQRVRDRNCIDCDAPCYGSRCNPCRLRVNNRALRQRQSEAA